MAITAIQPGGKFAAGDGGAGARAQPSSHQIKNKTTKQKKEIVD